MLGFSAIAGSTGVQAQTSLTSAGIYTRYITNTGNYTVTITGGSGAKANNGNGGGVGATTTATFALNGCDKLTIIVGQAGAVAGSDSRSGGGGGGGTAVILNGTTLLMVAGGGGGGGRFNAGGGGVASAAPVAAGGTSGTNGFFGNGGGGYGFNGANATGCSFITGGSAGTLTAQSAGGIGGDPNCAAAGNGGTGFGGGGGSGVQSGGGGGGYAGGNGVSQSGGGGGDSYVSTAGTTVTKTAGGTTTTPVDGAFNINTTLTTSPAYTFATTTNTATATISGSTLLINGCDIISTINPTGTAPVSGSVTATSYYDGSVQTVNSAPYIQRHYDITPATNASAATATVTLYFTQAEFTAYNAAPNHGLDLPTTTTDMTNASNLRITEYHGSPSGGTAPANYPTGAGMHVVLVPTVTYNNSLAVWQAVVSVTGFSGFFASSSLNNPLPVKLLSFAARKDGTTRNRIDWATATEDAGTAFSVERSANGSSFTTIGEAAGKGSSATYTSYDDQPLSGVNYYRLRMTEASGKENYSTAVIVRGDAHGGSVTVSPIPATNIVRITNSDASLTGGSAVIYNMQGAEAYRTTLAADQTVDISSWPAGIYTLRLPAGEAVRIVKQ